jgi:hypothetical protein
MSRFRLRGIREVEWAHGRGTATYVKKFHAAPRVASRNAPTLNFEL